MHLHYESRCERRLLVNYLKEVDRDVAEVHGEFEEEACWELSRLQDRKQRWRNSWADNTPVMWFQRWCKNNTHSHVKGKLSGGASTKLLDPIVVKGFFKFDIKHLKTWQFWQTLTTEGQNKQRLSSTGSPLLFSLPTSDWRRQSTDILTSTLWHSCCHCASRKQTVTRGCGRWSSTSGWCSLFGSKHLQTQRCGYQLTGKIITSAFADQHSWVKETETYSTVLNWL